MPELLPEASPLLVGQRIVSRRHVLRLTQAQLAVRCGLSRSLLSDIECGHRAATVELAYIAGALHCLTSDLTRPPITRPQPVDVALACQTSTIFCGLNLSGAM